MYLVVGCGNCSNLWIVEEGQESAGCSRCGIRRPLDRLRTLGRAADAERARAIRTSLLEERSETNGIDAIEALGEDPFRPVVSDDELLRGKGLDPAGVDPATGSEDGSSDPRTAILEAVSRLDQPTREAILTEAETHGVDQDRAATFLERLHRRGTLVKRGATYHRT